MLISAPLSDSALSTLHQLTRYDHCVFTVQRLDSYWADEEPVDRDVYHVENATKPYLPTDYLACVYLASGDYCGTTCELSNVRAFTRDYGDHPGVYHTYSGYGYHAILVQLWVLDNDDSGIVDTLQELLQYPVVDDDTLYDVERELFDEYAADTARGDQFTDISRAIRDVLGLANDHNEVNSPYLTLWCDVMSDSGRLRAIYDAYHDGTIEPEYETQSWPYVRWEKFAQQFIAQCNARAYNMRRAIARELNMLVEAQVQTGRYTSDKWSIALDRLGDAYILWWKIEAEAEGNNAETV